MRSELKAVETQGCASPLNTVEAGLTRVAVLTWAPDGYRVYESFHVLRIGEHWEEDKAAAVEWTRRHGNKLSKQEARRYFLIPDDMPFAG